MSDKKSGSPPQGGKGGSSKGSKNAGQTNKTKGSLTKVVVKEDDVGNWITPEKAAKFYLDEDAKFPSIEFSFQSDCAGPFKWTWEMKWDAHVSGLREKARGKKVASFKDKGSFSSSDKRWDASAINKPIGGKLTVTVEFQGEKLRRTVQVLGTQPSTDKIKAYLKEKSATAFEKLIAQESKFKHFIALDREPVVAGDKGYGLAQLTTPPPTYSQVWCWKENLDGGIKLMDGKKKEAKNMLDQHGASSYTEEMLDLETLSRWNGGSYHEWNAITKKWQRKDEIKCDTQTGNIGWDMTVAANKGKTEKELRERDVDEYPKMKAGQTAEHPWIYTGVCYADHLNEK